MKIAFVGKGGSGKTTTASLFAQYAALHEPVLAIDADINMHMVELYQVGAYSKDELLSEKAPSAELKTYLMGDNPRIASLDHFKKSTPPGRGSHLIRVLDQDDWFMNRFCRKVTDKLSLSVVGTYSEDGIASSCYHNNLAVLENTLSHMTDEGLTIVDMVAGTDAFASTLFAQFDVLFFVAEPTTRSLAVYTQYAQLAQKGGVGDRLFVVGNKVEDKADEAFIRDVVGADRLVASISRSGHILAVDKGRATLDSNELDAQDILSCKTILDVARSQRLTAQERLPLLWKLHEIYVSQLYVKDKFGDLTAQIDTSFDYTKA